MISDFVEWAKTQPFYENTTIVIVGDHLTMQRNFMDENSQYVRGIYNVFINSPIQAQNEKNRIFTSMDIFPTTLAALGAKIEGDRLAIGTNLFSSRKTLAEEMGVEALESELRKRSIFYNNTILGDSYYEMQERMEEDSVPAGYDY
jgi:phosphoglycerol transferase